MVHTSGLCRHLVTVFAVLGHCLLVAQGTPAENTLFVIAESRVNSKENLVVASWDGKAWKTTILSGIPESYSSMSTYAGYDPVKSRFYWSTGPGKLFTRDLEDSGSQTKTLLTLKSKDSLPFTIDDVTRLIYYAKGTGNGPIYAMTIDGKFMKPLVDVTGGVSQIDTDPAEGYIFWLSSSIYRCDITGKNIVKVVSASSLRSFTVGRMEKAIYYISDTTNLHKVPYTGINAVKLNFDARSLRTLMTAGDGILYGITFSRGVMKINASSLKSEVVSTPQSIHVSNRGIAFYSTTATRGSNGCTATVHPCSHICLPGPNKAFECACPEKHIMKSDNKTCEKLITCKMITPPDHSTVNCSRTPQNKQLCSFKCDSGYVYHPRYVFIELFECRSNKWLPEPDLHPCLPIIKPSGVRVYVEAGFNATSPCDLLKRTNTKLIGTETVTLIAGITGPLGLICAANNDKCDKVGTPVSSCDQPKDLLKVRFHVDIVKPFDDNARLLLKQAIDTKFAAATQAPSKHKLSILGAEYPLVYLTLVKLGFVCGAMHEETDVGCVACPSGTSYNSTIDTCTLCPRGWYSVKPKSFRCTQCGPDQTTPREGAASPLNCKEFCKAGYFYNSNKRECQDCPVGSYQDTPGMEPCKSCGENRTTYGKASTSASDCLGHCLPGQFHNKATKTCQPCKRNTYQDLHWSFTCQKCPPDRITEKEGAIKKEQCIRSCPVGHFFHSAKGHCDQCPASYYQDTPGATSCIHCEHGLVSKPGSVSESDCKNETTTPKPPSSVPVIAGAVGGAVGFVVILVIVVAVVLRKKLRSDGPIIEEGRFEETPVDIHNPWAIEHDGIINGDLAPDQPHGGMYAPRHAGYAVPEQIQPNTYTGLGLDSLPPPFTWPERSRIHDPFARQPIPPPLPEPRYSPSPARAAATDVDDDQGSGIYVDPDDDGYEALKIRDVDIQNPPLRNVGDAADNSQQEMPGRQHLDIELDTLR